MIHPPVETLQAIPNAILIASISFKLNFIYTITTVPTLFMKNLKTNNKTVSCEGK
jgi:hypothetical protein